MSKIKNCVIICFGLICFISATHAQNSNELAPADLDVEKERPEIESTNALYAKYLLEGDSTSIAALYATDGKIGCKKGPEILSSAGSWIRDNIKNDSRNVIFKTVTLNSDGNFLIETGMAEAKSDKGELKYTFQYLIVWKKESGFWKIYRDVGL